jgi:5-oxopent-3-ene-1,2,5-tricarboxylate decarboxylase/2-hydroxyhepta-2,4-diene-1,7-dioate isomerase
MKTVVGALLNFQGAWAAMEAVMQREPHFKPPVHPVLYIKPANTWCASGTAVGLAPEVDAVQAGPTLGVVFRRTAARVSERDALSFVAGYVAVNDLTIAHEAVLRPPMKQKCRDGFCPIGPITLAEHVPNPNALALRTWVNGELRQDHSTAHLRRSVQRLIADVTEFMSLHEGDILLVGVPEDPPLLHAGDEVSIEIEGVGRVTNRLVREGMAR